MTTTVTSTHPVGKTHSVTLDLDSDDLLQPDYAVGRPFRPLQLRLTWIWNADRGVWKLDTAQAVGPRLKTDGTPSQQSYGKRDYARTYSTDGEHLVSDTPEWVRAAVEQLDPDAQ